MTDPEQAPVLFDVRLPDLTLDRGGRVRPLVVRGWMWAPDGASFLARRGLKTVTAPAAEIVRSDEARAAPWASPAGPAPEATIVVIHALTGHAVAGGADGWWSPVIGPGRALDPTTHRILSFNHLGSCYGTTGPNDPGFEGGAITTWDQARVLLAALDALGIDRIALVTGGSLGAMVTLALAALAPDRVERIAPIAGCAAASAWIIGFNHVQRRAIQTATDPQTGLAIARQIAMLTYRAEPGLDLRQGRAPAEPRHGVDYRMQSYLDYQGLKLTERFVVSTYLAMMDAMDHHDLARPPVARDPHETWRWNGDVSGLDRIAASCLAVGIDSDQLFFPRQSEAIVDALAERGVVARCAMIRSPFGHDAFLIEWDQLDEHLRRALALPVGSLP